MYFYVFSLYGYRCAGVAVQYRRQRFSTSAPVHRPVPCLLLVSHFSLPLPGFLITVHVRAVFPLPSVTRCRKVMPFQDHPGHVWLQRNVQTEVNELRRSMLQDARKHGRCKVFNPRPGPSPQIFSFQNSIKAEKHGRCKVFNPRPGPSPQIFSFQNGIKAENLFFKFYHNNHRPPVYKATSYTTIKPFYNL
jgi:hypothetical protein